MKPVYLVSSLPTAVYSPSIQTNFWACCSMPSTPMCMCVRCTSCITWLATFFGKQYLSIVLPTSPAWPVQSWLFLSLVLALVQTALSCMLGLQAFWSSFTALWASGLPSANFYSIDIRILVFPIDFVLFFYEYLHREWLKSVWASCLHKGIGRS